MEEEKKFMIPPAQYLSEIGKELQYLDELFDGLVWSLNQEQWSKM